MPGKPARFQHLPLALILGLGFMVLSYGRHIGDTQSQAFRGKILDSIFAGPIVGTKMFWNLVLFATAQIALHLAYGAFCWGMGRIAQIAWPSPNAKPRDYLLLSFLLLTAMLLANNAAGFTFSALGEPYADTMTAPIAGISLGRWIVLLIASAAVATCVVAFVRLWKAGSRPSMPMYLGAGFLAVAYLGSTGFAALSSPGEMDAKRPNVVLIGLDSLRDDLVAKETSPGATPNVSAFLAGGARFSNAMTPMARTFPSMTTILTGRHPHTTGAVMNLLPRDMIKEGDTLGRIFKRAGYATAYATDEVRFSNIDTTYGFDRMVSPPIGSTEFLLGMVADTPLSNAVVNTTLGKWLFPHVHANRGAAKTYDPDAFIDRVESEIPFDQPLFLGVHLTLAHWPYRWADAPREEANLTDRWPKPYLNAVRRVDRQFQDLMDVLERKGVLRNAIVVLYSDHGESFALQADSLVPEANALIEEMHATPVWGHGTTVLSSHQFRVVLAVRGFGASQATSGAAREIPVPVSLEDVAPTLLALTGTRSDTQVDGHSLAPLMRDERGAGDAFAGRIRFTETEYQPANLASLNGNISTSVFQEATRVYSVNGDTDRLEVRRSRMGGLLKLRQYAALGDTLLLAAIPNHPGPESHRFVVVAQAGGIPEEIVGGPSADAPAELRRLWTALHLEFKGLLPVPASAEPTATVAKAPVSIHERVFTTSVNK